MCLLIESIKIKEGNPVHLAYHQKRMNKSRKEYWGCEDEIVLTDSLFSTSLPGLVKVRLLYEKKILNRQYIPYQFPVIRSLKVIEADAIEYAHKYADRSSLKSLFLQKEEADDILIVKNGQVTDTYFCNVVFERNNRFYTPSSYLLPGTQRQFLLDHGRIQERDILLEDIFTYERVHLINAMMDLEDGVSVDIEKILL